MEDEKKEEEKPSKGRPIVTKEITEALIKECNDKDWGISQVGTPNFHLIVMGDKAFTPDQIFILIAHTMLQMILTGAAHTTTEDDANKEWLANLPVSGDKPS